MLSFREAIERGGWDRLHGSYRMQLADNYEIWFERLIYDDQWYLAVYYKGELVTPKVVVKPGLYYGADDHKPYDESGDTVHEAIIQHRKLPTYMPESITWSIRRDMDEMQ